MMKQNKQLIYERERYSYFIERLTKGRVRREYLSKKTIHKMLTEFFETHQDVEKQAFEDLKDIYEIREDSMPKDKYGQENFLRNMFRLYQIIYQVQSPDDPLICSKEFNLEDYLKHKLKNDWNKIEGYWGSFKNNEKKLSEVVSKGNEMFGDGFILNLMPLIGKHKKIV